ncbi:MAG: hypothetical protein M3N26_05870 [Pseudomonadota bacterium]|nr:hypothetical protein [Pseudomonadota bacterium]
MRRLTPLLLLVALTGCTGLGEFMDHTFTNPRRNPNVPMADSENVRRIRGLAPATQPLEVEPGNVWPKFDTREPTLEDVGKNPGREDSRGFAPTIVPGARPGLPAGRQPIPTRGSSTPPGQVQPDSLNIPNPSLASPPPTANAPRPPGGVVNTPAGPAVDTGGTNGYRTLNTPTGPGAIVVPNGNGTSTVIKPDGTVQTITTPR